jgi:hypothetical protein
MKYTIHHPTMSIFLFDEEETKGKINIDDLYEKQQKKDLKQISIFNKILNRIHNKIRITSRNRNGDKYIWFTVPEYIFGESVYQQADCIAYLVDKLEENKFHIRYMHPNTLFVSWAHIVPSYVRTEIKKKMGIIMDEYGNVVDKVEGREDVNLNERLMGMQATAAPTVEKKIYTPITNYKPTGKFVYDPSLFETLEKKLE